MSALAAAISVEANAPAPQVVPAMLEAIAYRGGDRVGIEMAGSAALGIGQRFVTREDREAEQPFSRAAEAPVVVIDGFIANFAALRRDLASAGHAPRGASDAELVACAYAAWGDRFLARLDGEFALIVWDPRRRALLAARDPVGVRPLVYRFDGRSLLVASDLAAILAALPERPPLEEAYLLQTLSGLQYSAEDTPWQGIRRLPPAHLLVAEAGRIRETLYWEPDFDARITHRSDAGYESDYREVLFECVREWSRSAAPVACHVSGGLDSSAIFAVADRLLDRGELLAPDMLGFAFGIEPGDPADEESYSRAVEDHVGRGVARVPLTLPPLPVFESLAASYADCPPYPNVVMNSALIEAAVAAGCRVHIGGLGGDNWLDGTHDYYRQELAALRLDHVLADLRADVAAIGPRETASRFVRSGLGRLLPEAARRPARALIGRARPDEVAECDWLLTAEARGILAERRAAWDAMLARYPLQYRESVFKLRNAGFQESLRESDRHAARHGAELRSPMFSKRFIQFACATPERQRLRGDRNKDVHRRALAGLLPETVLDRTTKASFGAVFGRLYHPINRFIDASPPQPLAKFVMGDLREMLRSRYGSLDSWPPYPIWNAYAAWLLASFAR